MATKLVVNRKGWCSRASLSSASVQEEKEETWLRGLLISNSSLLLTFPDSDKTPWLGFSYSQETMAEDRTKPCELDQEKYDADDNVKIICLGDSAVGKSKYVGRLGKNNEAPYLLWASKGGVLAGAQTCMGDQRDHISICVH